MSVTRICDICGRGQPEVSRWTLTRKERDESGVNHSFAKGGIDLCITDWQRICQPRMRGETAEWNYAAEPTCDRDGSRTEVTRYSLKRSRRIEGLVKDTPGGGISLCHECWLGVARPKMRQRRLVACAT